MLSSDEKRAIDAELAAVPDPRGACLGALKVVQCRHGWVPDEVMAELAAYLMLTVDELESVATFYNIIHRRPVGRHVIYVCDSVSCWMLGSDGLVGELRQLLGIGPGETSADGRFTLLPIACLGNCEHAPALMIGRELHRDLTPGELPALLERYK